MPIRMVRNWTNSDKVNKLSPQAERFFIRLIMSADDLGSFYGDPRLLRASLFPLLIDDIKTKDVDSWISECWTAGLVEKYNHGGKEWLHIIDFGQRMDRARSKYPAFKIEDAVTPPQSAGTSGQNTNTKGNRNEKPKPISPRGENKYPDEVVKEFDKFIGWIEFHAPAVNKMEIPFSIDHFLSLKTNYSKEHIRDMILRMGNYKPLLKKNKSANLTFINWSKNGFSSGGKQMSGLGLAAAKTVREIKSSSS